MLPLRRNPVHKVIKPAALSERPGLEGSIESYDDAIACLNLLQRKAQTEPLTEIELEYQHAAIVYMYDIIDTLIGRLTEVDTARFSTIK